MRDSDLASQLQVPPWKLKSLVLQARSWDEQGLDRAIQAVALADAQIKGQASDGSYAIEKMIMEICAARN